jgi:CRP/FNR family cyclic AMP-dependent transcriptional regulator
MSLASVAVFKGLPSEAFTLLEQGSIRLEPGDGTAIFVQGTPADAVYAIVAGDGHVRIGAIDRNGKALMVEIVRTGEIFGEIGVIDGASRTASAVVEGRVQLVKIRGAAFMTALATCPALGHALCLQVRLARQILYLAAREGRPTRQGLRLTHRFRQADLADLLGATTRSIITILNAWRTSGIVTYDTDRALLTVQDIDALQAIVESDRER